MIKPFIIVATLAASCAFPAVGTAETRTDTPRATSTTTSMRPLDPARRAWFVQAGSLIPGDRADPPRAPRRLVFSQAPRPPPPPPPGVDPQSLLFGDGGRV